MDLIFYANSLGNNVVSVYIDTKGLTSVDVILTDPCNSSTKNATLTAVECNGYYELNFYGVESFYEDLSSGLIYFDSLGTWKVEIFQNGSSVLLETINLQITN